MREVKQYATTTLPVTNLRRSIASFLLSGTHEFVETRIVIRICDVRSRDIIVLELSPNASTAAVHDDPDWLLWHHQRVEESVQLLRRRFVRPSKLIIQTAVVAVAFAVGFCRNL